MYITFELNNLLIILMSYYRSKSRNSKSVTKDESSDDST